MIVLLKTRGERINKFFLNHDLLSRIAFFIMIVPAGTFILMALDWGPVSGLHELGHVVTALATNVKIYRVDWHPFTSGQNGVYVGGAYPWQVTAISLAGGLFASFLLFLTYVLLSIYNRKDEAHLTRFALLNFIKVIILSATMQQLFAGLLEGVSPKYLMMINTPELIFALSIIPTFISVLVHEKVGFGSRPRVMIEGFVGAAILLLFFYTLIRVSLGF